MEAGEGFELVERAQLIEHRGVHLDGGVRAEHTGAAAGGLLGVLWMRRAVGAEEEVAVAAGDGVA